MDEIEKLNQELDLMLSSEDAVQTALDSDNPMLRLAAHMADDRPAAPSELIKAKIQTKVDAAKIARPNYFAWAGGLAATVALVFMLVSFSGFLNNNSGSEDKPSINLTLSGLEAEATESSFADNFATEEANSETTDIVEVTETVLADTGAPTDKIEVQVTESSISVQSDSSNVALTDPGGKVNVRSGPSTSSEIIATLTPNTEVRVLGTNAAGDWTQVVLSDGRQGWISTPLLSEKLGTDGQPIAPGGTGRDTEQCERGNSCNAPGQTGENQNNGNGRGQANN